MKRQHILKQMGVMVLSAVLSLTPAMQVAAAVPEDGTQILETEDSAEADTASATQEESAGEEAQPAETEVTPTKEVTASPEPETEESTAKTTEESTAETTTETTEESTEQKTEESTAETTEESTAGTTEEEDAENSGKREDTGKAAEQQMIAGANSINAITLSGAEGQDAENPNAQQASENQQVQAQDADTADDQSGYDINKPVLENVWLPQSGQTLTREDTLEIRVQAYDADSGIASVTAGLAFGTGDTNSWSDSVYLEFDEEQQNYVGLYPLTDILATDGCVSSVTVTDQAGNYISEYSWEGTMLDKEECRFQIRQDEILIDSKAVTLDFNHQGATLNVGEYLDVSLQMSPPLDESLPYTLYTSWENPETQNGITWSLSVTSEGTYEGTYSTDNYMTNGKWILTEIYAEIQGEQYPINTDALGDLSGYWFELQGSTEVPEPESPIEEVILEPCGEMLQPGDTVSLKIKAAGDDQKWENDAWADFYPAVDIDWNKHFSVDLTYNPDTQMFEGSYTVTEETYPTEWYLESVYLTDTATYNGYYYRTDEILDAEYYFLVENDGTFTNPSFDVEVQFRAIDEGGYYNEVASFSAEDVVRRTTYAEAGITAPEAPDYIPEGLQFVGWVDEYGNPFDSERQLLYGSYVTFYAQYDQRMMTVNYSYLGKDNATKYESLAIYVPQELTYGELKTLVLREIPDITEQVSEEIQFEGWEVSIDAPDDENVPLYMTTVQVNPQYGKVYVILSYRFINSNGSGYDYAQDRFFMDEGSTVGDLRELVAEHPYPEEGYQDLGFVGWIIPNLEDEEVLSGESRYTVDASYEKNVVYVDFSYISENGYPAGWNQIFLMDTGSTYGDLIDQISEIAPPEDIYTELGFKGWSMGYPELVDTPLPAQTSLYFSAEYENALIQATYNYINAQGKSESEIVKKLVPAGSSWKDVKQEMEGFALPEACENLTFEKWEFPSWLSDDTVFTGSNSILVNAYYGDPLLYLRYKYSTENRGVVHYKEQMLQVPEGTTYRELAETAVDYAPEDVYDAGNVQWICGYYYNQDTEVSNFGSVEVSPSYENHTNLLVNMSYATEKGHVSLNQYMWILEDGTTYQEVNEELSAMAAPETYPGLQFQGWYLSGPTEGVIQDNSPSMTMVAQYDKYLIHFVVDARLQEYENVWDIPQDMDFDVDQIVLADPGEQLQLPAELEGYTRIIWLDTEGADTVTINAHTTYYGYGTKTGTDPENPEEPTDPVTPVDPEEPTDPETPVDPETPEEPTDPEPPVVPETPEDTSRLPEELENVVVQEIAEAQPGQTVTVDMQSATVVTREMLGAAKGKDVDIQLNLGGYSWTINGRDIMASDLSDINLEVKQNTGAIPNRVIQSMAGDNPVQQLSLTHNGNFGFRASLTINVGSENSGKYGNLYYYDSTGKMVFMNAGVIDANGNVTLSFSHASEYLVVVNDTRMSDADVPADLRPGSNSSGGAVTTPVSTGNASAGAGNTTSTSVTKTGEDVVNTADATPTAWAGAFLLAALVLAGVGAYQKRRNA